MDATQSPVSTTKPEFDPSLLKILCCPETHQELRMADEGLLRNLNTRIVAGELHNRAGGKLTGTLDGGLVRADGNYLYPLRGQIPVLLVDEAIALG